MKLKNYKIAVRLKGSNVSYMIKVIAAKNLKEAKQAAKEENERQLKYWLKDSQAPKVLNTMLKQSIYEKAK